MFVTKRDGRKEDVNLDKITNSVSRVCEGFKGVDYYKIAIKTVGGLYDGVTTKELDLLSIQTAVGSISEDPIYSRVAGRLLANFIKKEVENQDIHSFSQSIEVGYREGLISEETYEFVKENKRKLNNAIKNERNDYFEYYGLRIVYDRYLLKHPKDRLVIESPQYWFMRVACGLASDAKEAIEFYNLISSLEYMPSTPTLFNSGTTHSQMSSCYLLDSPLDDLYDIYKRYQDVAMLSKWAGGIGLSISRVRSNGELIKGTNGKSNGVVPWIHTLDSSVAAVNQGGKRKGAACVYLETWHPDIFEFLELRDNTGDKEKRAHNLNIANWVPDLFMKRVQNDEQWSLFGPTVAPELTDLFGDDFEKRYLELEIEEKYARQVPARKLYARMMRTLAETGNGWMCFKDTSNKKCNSAVDGNVIHLSNLCTEILEPTSAGTITSVDEFDYSKRIKNGETAVCNLGSINLSRGYLKEDGRLDKVKLRKNVAIAIKYLDKVIDKNYYPIPEAAASNLRWRPIGLGLMGLQDLFFQLKLPFESEEAIQLSVEIQEEIYYQALKTSCELAKELGPHKDWKKTHAAKGELQFDLWGVTPGNAKRFEELKEDIKKNGLRNSLMIAIAPTATISSIVGAYECIEPQVSNLFRRVTLSGDFIQTNKYLVRELMERNLWNTDLFNKIKINDGSVQDIDEIPQDLQELFKTVWECKQRSLIDHAIARGAYIDQSQSLNLFVNFNNIPEEKRVGVLSSMYMYAWQNGIKTTYYLRSRAATQIQKVTVSGNSLVKKDEPEASSLVLDSNSPEADLENPDICESCT